MLQSQISFLFTFTFLKFLVNMAAEEHKLNIKLVQEIEKYPFLYNYRLPEYARRDVTEKAWTDIGEKVNLSGPECKEKWKNLRSVFARRLKRRSAGATHKKPYYLEKYMKFTIPFLKISSSKILDLHSEGQETFVDTETDEEQEVWLPSVSSQSVMSPHSPPNLRKRPENVETSYSETDLLESDEQSSSLKKPVKRRISEDSNAGKYIPSYLKQPDHKCMTIFNTTLRVQRNFEQTSNKMFLLSLLADMNAMNDKQRRFFRQRVLGLIEDILNMDKHEQ